MRLLLEGEDENEPPAELVIPDVAELNDVQEAVRRALSIAPANPVEVPLEFYEPVSGAWHRLVNVRQLPKREGLPVKVRCGMSAKPCEFPKPRLVVLGRDSHEFQMVQQELERMSQANASSFVIDCIERVENAGLEALFEAQLASLKHPAARLKLLYSPSVLPGTGGRSLVLEICRKGFSRSIWNEGDFGSGIYFPSGQVTRGQILAADAVAPKIILCEVAVGAVMNVPAGLGNQEASFRDLDLESVRRAGFDSLRVFDSDDLTSELTSTDPLHQDTHIVYHPFQALPRYVVSLHTASAESEASKLSPARASKTTRLSPPSSAGRQYDDAWGGEGSMEELRRARALENKAEAASVLAREARARAARLDAVVREAHAAAAAVNAARERQEQDLERVTRDASRAGDAAALLEEHLANIHDSIRRDRALALRKQTLAEAMALVHRSMLCSRELTHALPAIETARSRVMDSSTELLVALDEEEAKLMSALRATWADYRDSIRKEVESKTGAIDAYKARLDQIAAALGRSQSGVHAQKAAARDETCSEQDLLHDVSELHEHEGRIKEAMAAAQALLASPPPPFAHQLHVDPTFHAIFPQLLARCISLQSPAPATEASLGSKDKDAGLVNEETKGEGEDGEEDSQDLTSALARILFDGPSNDCSTEGLAERKRSAIKTSRGIVEGLREEDRPEVQSSALDLDLTRLPAEINRLTSSLRSAQLAASAYVMASGGHRVNKPDDVLGNGGGVNAQETGSADGGAGAGHTGASEEATDGTHNPAALLNGSVGAGVETVDASAKGEALRGDAEDAAAEAEAEAATEQVHFEPDGGEYFNVVRVNLSSATPGAEIFFSITPQGDMSSLEADPQVVEGVLQRVTGPITFRNDKQATCVKLQISAVAYARDSKASPIALSRTFTLLGMQALEWDMLTATNGLAAFGGIQACRLENKTGHAISRVRAKSPLPGIGRCWWEVVVERGVPDGNIAASGVGVCVGLVLVPENDRKREQWQTEQLGGNFSWCFNISRGWIVHKGERKAYGRKALMPNQRIGVHVSRSEQGPGTISFSVDGVDMGVAYTGVPPCELFPVVNIPLKGCVLHSEPYIRGSL